MAWGSPRARPGWGAPGCLVKSRGVKADGCAGRLSKGPDFRPALLSPRRCSLPPLPPSSEQQAQQHATLAISRSQLCGADGCRHPQQPPPPASQTDRVASANCHRG